MPHASDILDIDGEGFRCSALRVSVWSHRVRAWLGKGRGRGLFLIAARFLHLAVLRYVDDYFGPEG